jgi:Domain of unknown function (DUF3825)
MAGRPVRFRVYTDTDAQLKLLAEEAEVEDWSYHFIPSEHPYPVLFNFIRYTYRRVADEGKIVLSDDGQYASFNTGLVTPHQEAIYASFEANRKENAQPWFFKAWYRRGRWELNKFPELPELAHYFDDPSCLVLDVRKDVRVNVEHIIEENRSYLHGHSALSRASSRHSDAKGGDGRTTL